MPFFSSAPQDISQFRVEKARVPATLTLSNRESIKGSFFVAGSSDLHPGSERVEEVLNREPGFFPFEVETQGARRSALYNRDHVLVVALGANREAQLAPDYDVATRWSVSMLLSNGMRLTGLVSVRRPHGRDRLSDFARSSSRFWYLEACENTYLVNIHHLVELVEEPTEP